MDSHLVLWIVLAAAFIALEVATMAFVAIYFALGAIAAAIVAWLDGGLEWQLLAFSVAGIALLALTRGLLKRTLESPDIATNVDRMVGKGGIVTIPIDNDASTGQIRVGTEYWTARWPEDQNGGTIGVDERVTIVAVEGVTARVVRRTDEPIA